MNKKYYLFKCSGEIISILYIISTFFNSKLNMKLGYLLLIIYLIKFLIDKNKNKELNLDIYKLFLVIFILGIIWNYISAGNLGVAKFIRQNDKFIYGFILYNLLYLVNKNIFNIAIFISINISAYLFMYNKIPYLLLDDLGRFRIILSIGFVYSLIYTLNKILKSNKNFWILIFLIFPSIALINSGSRMFVLAIIATIFLYCLFIYFYDKNKWKKLFFSLIVILVLISLNIPKGYIGHIKTSFETEKNLSNEDRIVMWKFGLKIIKDHPVFGIGSNDNNIYPLIQSYVKENIKNENLKNEFLRENRFAKLHNMYIDLFVQNGIIGLCFLLIFFFVIPLEFLKGNKNSESISGFFTLIFYYFYGLTWSLWTSIGISQVLFQIMLAWMFINLKKDN